MGNSCFTIPNSKLILFVTKEYDVQLDASPKQAASDIFVCKSGKSLLPKFASGLCGGEIPLHPA